MSRPESPFNPSAPGSTFFRALFDAAIDGIVVIDRHGTILDVNQSLLDLFGYSESSEVTGRNVSMLMDTPHREAHDGYISRYLETGEARIIGIGRKVQGLHKEGRHLDLRLSVSQFTAEGEPLFTGVLHDIGPIVEAEDRLKALNTSLENKVEERTAELAERTSELEVALTREKELGELKSRFLTMASHEFRTPLAAILSSTNLMARYAASEDQPKRIRHVERIRETVSQLTAILNDFLSVGRLEEGRIVVRPEPFDLSEMLSDWLERFEESLEKEVVQLQLVKAPVSHPVDQDPSLLRAILVNLLSNAVKYSEDDSPILVGLEASESGFRLTVEDSGIGIPAKDQPHMFERFFRAPNASHIQGTGLGLHIVAHYARLMGGEVSFQSEEGKGSTFIVELPDQCPAQD